MGTDETDRVPQQERSRATRRRLVATTNRLLKSRAFGTLSVQEIATEADCSIGAFYGRFRGKDDLLSPLLDRHYRGILRGLRRAMAGPGWRSMTLDERLEWITRMTVWAFRSRRWLIRALVVYLRQDSGPAIGANNAQRTELILGARNLLSDFTSEIEHADRENAIDFALFLISTLCRERVLFGELSERTWIAEGDEGVVTEIAGAARAYLTAGAGVRGIWLGA